MFLNVRGLLPAGANILLMIIGFTPNFLLDDSQKGPKSHLEILAEMRDYKRRRQSYRAKNVHITKKSYTEVRSEKKKDFFAQKCLFCMSINNYILFQRQIICVFLCFLYPALLLLQTIEQCFWFVAASYK